MAGFQDQYPNLPGHLVQFRDGNLNLPEDPTPAATESIVLLGTATDGPVMQPVRVTPQSATAIFGKMTHPNGVANGATLLPAFEEAWAAGCRDIRLMRISGKVATLTLKGTTYTETKTEIQEDNLGVSQGNAETIFTLKHGGIDAGSLEVEANGIKLPASAYTLDPGTASDLSAGVDPEVKATLTLHEDATDMKANITVRYTYDYTDATGTPVMDVTYEGNTDNAGTPMKAQGADKVFTLSQVPKAGLKLYADGGEVFDSASFTVDAVAKTVTVHSTDKILRGQVLEASYAYDQVNVVTPTIELESGYGGNVYNETKGKVEVASGVVTVTFTKPEAKKALMSEPPMTFKSTDFPSFQLFVNAVNSHPDNNGVIRAKTKYPNQLTSTLEPKNETYFTGGSDELNLSKDELYERLGGKRDSEGYVVSRGAYQLLENYRVDYVIPLGVYADDKLVGKYDNFAYQLGLACAVMSHYNNVTMGVISTSSPEETTLAGIQDHVDKLLANPLSFYMRDRFGNEIKDGEGNRIDLGQYIQVVAGPDLIVANSRLGLVATNSPAPYFGFVTTLPVQSAPTNKVLPSVRGVRFEYSAAQLNALIGARYVTYGVKPNTGQVYVVDSMTAAHKGSDYTRLSTARVVKRAVTEVRTACDPYLGEPNDPASRNAMGSSVSKKLGIMKEVKALRGFDFNIVSNPQMELLGEASIELSLQAPNELRRITTIVGLQV